MEITVFAKKRTDQNGKVFYNYIGRLTRKSTGETVTVQVKFRSECGAPDPHKCPRTLSFDKGQGNYSEKTIQRNDGSTIISRVLWLNGWNDKGDYVDNSLDDFV